MSVKVWATIGADAWRASSFGRSNLSVARPTPDERAAALERHRALPGLDPLLASRLCEATHPGQPVSVSSQ